MMETLERQQDQHAERGPQNPAGSHAPDKLAQYRAEAEKFLQTGDAAILPTPVVGVLGVIDDVSRRTPIGFRESGHLVYVLGETRDEFGGSEWAHAVQGHLGGRPPRVDLGAERALAEALIAASRDGLLGAAHDLSEGGLAQGLVEACLRGGLGVRIRLPAGLDPFVALLSESTARAIVAVSASSAARLAELCDKHGVPVAPIGEVGGAELDVTGQFVVPLDELRTAHEATLPGLFAE
jgi:phosphoribosylformylglycinamidine synthase